MIKIIKTILSMRGTNLMVKSISLGILVTKDAIGIKKATDIQFVVHGRKIEVHDWETNCAFFMCI